MVGAVYKGKGHRHCLRIRTLLSELTKEKETTSTRCAVLCVRASCEQSCLSAPHVRCHVWFPSLGFSGSEVATPVRERVWLLGQSSCGVPPLRASSFGGVCLWDV